MEKSLTINYAIPYLEGHLRDIHTVQEWAYCMGYSRSYFSVIIKKEYGKSPYQMIRERKYRRVQYLVKKNPYEKGVVIAQKAGLENVKKLYKFLVRNYGITLSKLRKQAINGL